jgi:hypothetical protein
MIRNLNNTIKYSDFSIYLYNGYKLSNEYDYYLIAEIPYTRKGYTMFNDLNQAKSSIKFQISESKSRFLDQKEYITNEIEKYDSFKYQLADTVKYANRKYSLVGYCFNNYAQMELVNPFLIDFKSISRYVNSLFGSKLSLDEIVELTNTYFRDGKFDDDIIIPFVNVKEDSDDLTVVDKGPTQNEIEKFIDRQYGDKIYKLKKNIFLEAFTRNSEVVSEIKEKNETIYNELLNVAYGINNLINDKIETGFKPKPKKKITKSKEPKIESVESVEFDIENLIL